MLGYFGFVRKSEIRVDYPDNFNFTNNIDVKLEYLKALQEQEDSRQETIDSKTSQLVGQTGIIFSLAGLFIPMYIDRFSRFDVVFQITVIIIFLLTLFFYLLAIGHATKYLNVRRYKYAQRSTITVKKDYLKDHDLKVEEVKDLIYMIEKNTQINNQKADDLIYGYRSFRAGNFLIGGLSVLLLTSIYFSPKSQTPSIKLENPVNLNRLDSSLKDIRKELPTVQRCL